MHRSGSVLAAFVQTHLGLLDESEPVAAQAVRRALAPEVLARIEKSSRIAWIPVEDHVELTDRIQREVGKEAGRELCRSMVLAAFEQPFMRPIVTAALAITGPSVERFAAWAPRSWPALYRRAGRLCWELVEPGEGHMILAAPPPVLRESAPYVEGLAGGFQALFDVTQETGRVTGRTLGEDIVLELRWHPAEPGSDGAGSSAQ